MAVCPSDAALLSWRPRPEISSFVTGWWHYHPCSSRYGKRCPCPVWHSGGWLQTEKQQQGHEPEGKPWRVWHRLYIHEHTTPDRWTSRPQDPASSVTPEHLSVASALYLILHGWYDKVHSTAKELRVREIKRTHPKMHRVNGNQRQNSNQIYTPAIHMLFPLPNPVCSRKQKEWNFNSFSLTFKHIISFQPD